MGYTTRGSVKYTRTGNILYIRWIWRCALARKRRRRTPENAVRAKVGLRLHGCWLSDSHTRYRACSILERMNIPSCGYIKVTIQSLFVLMVASQRCACRFVTIYIYIQNEPRQWELSRAASIIQGSRPIVGATLASVRHTIMHSATSRSSLSLCLSLSRISLAAVLRTLCTLFCFLRACAIFLFFH